MQIARGEIERRLKLDAGRDAGGLSSRSIVDPLVDSWGNSVQDCSRRLDPHRGRPHGTCCCEDGLIQLQEGSATLKVTYAVMGQDTHSSPRVADRWWCKRMRGSVRLAPRRVSVRLTPGRASCCRRFVGRGRLLLCRGRPRRAASVGRGGAWRFGLAMAAAARRDSQGMVSNSTRGPRRLQDGLPQTSTMWWRFVL